MKSPIWKLSTKCFLLLKLEDLFPLKHIQRIYVNNVFGSWMKFSFLYSVIFYTFIFCLIWSIDHINCMCSNTILLGWFSQSNEIKLQWNHFIIDIFNIIYDGVHVYVHINLCGHFWWRNSWQSRLANLHEWVWVSLCPPFIRACAASKKKRLVNYYIWICVDICYMFVIRNEMLIKLNSVVCLNIFLVSFMLLVFQIKII